MPRKKEEDYPYRFERLAVSEVSSEEEKTSTIKKYAGRVAIVSDMYQKGEILGRIKLNRGKKHYILHPLNNGRPPAKLKFINLEGLSVAIEG